MRACVCACVACCADREPPHSLPPLHIRIRVATFSRPPSISLSLGHNSQLRFRHAFKMAYGVLETILMVSIAHTAAADAVASGWVLVRPCDCGGLRPVLLLYTYTHQRVHTLTH